MFKWYYTPRTLQVIKESNCRNQGRNDRGEFTLKNCLMITCGVLEFNKKLSFHLFSLEKYICNQIIISNMNHSDRSRPHSNQKGNLGQFHTKSDRKLWSLICYLFLFSLKFDYTAASCNITAHMWLLVKRYWNVFELVGHYLAIYLSFSLTGYIPRGNIL